MYKLQIELVPPSVQNTNGQSLSRVPLFSSIPQSRLGSLQSTNGLIANDNDQSLMSIQLPTSQINLPNYFSSSYNNNAKKFLHFTKSINNLYELSEEILNKCEKMYPNLVNDIEIISLQDSNSCDLDPDFIVKDVFNLDNTVRVILKNELGSDEVDDNISPYGSLKRKKLNNGTAQSNGSQQLNVIKKRPSAQLMKNTTNNTLRISTPLAHQIYPQPLSNFNQDKDNDEDNEDAGNRSFLPPPAQPQSPAIRISSVFDSKRIITSAENSDTVSKSETVDPNKSKQQRFLSGTPIIPTMTPNRVILSGQRVISEQSNNLNNRLFASEDNSRKIVQTPRITSGMLTIPEPKISEVEKILKEGPASPSSLLPAKPNRIPMKSRPSIDENLAVSDESSSNENEVIAKLEHYSNQDKKDIFKQPISSSSPKDSQRISSLEERIKQKTAFNVIGGTDSRRINTFSDNEIEEDGGELEKEINFAGNIGISKMKPTYPDNGYEQNQNSANVGNENISGEDDEEDVGNDTVRISRPNSRMRSSIEGLSASKSEVFAYKNILDDHLLGDSRQTSLEPTSAVEENDMDKNNAIPVPSTPLNKTDSSSIQFSQTQSGSKSAKQEEAKRIRAEKLAQREAAKVARLEEANRKKAEREAARKAKQEELLRKKAEREAEKKAKLEARGAAKIARQEELAKKRSQKSKENTPETESSEAQKQESTKNNSEEESDNTKERTSEMSSESSKNKLETEKDNEKANPIQTVVPPKPRVPVGLMTQIMDKKSESSSDSSSSEESSDEEDEEASSDEETSNNSKKSRRIVVDTPKGPISTRATLSNNVAIEHVPQSTQISENDQEKSATIQNESVPIRTSTTQSSGKTSPTKVKTMLQGLPPKTRPSLSSLSDLVSRGVPEVREKNFKLLASKQQQNLSKIQSEEESSESSDAIENSNSSDSSDSSDSDSDSSDDDNGYISIKSASQKLGKKKKVSGGFASLIEDSKRKS
ncbi:hypothetical protein Kpol_1018p1 [Vanderwaltozyma polyspora DSM 70294]|uniref:Nucleolar protein Dnt1-like N-terminal domain-containing protein n=1 Tax=Vanderwaltozyma polyspora (strain ATCC 22028 / DSM 70294 / BCRC 21397 / CBS 2163 / NBRC 10782 / NRRL Y-8283 / UCD 57-17) TaxID=436907 RepID=A7TDK4_VANPO|nr:uncharacterized protein Kpol_1018p1 [Vanderwaltozyma polyspora DSM 70294]EDO19474.1 hypothetical protein Kpol_1018p1 [Vanderwaltozyma polyspora DSM 70294]